MLVNNREIVIKDRLKIFRLQLQLSTFENFQLQLQQNLVIDYKFVSYNNSFSNSDHNCAKLKFVNLQVA